MIFRSIFILFLSFFRFANAEESVKDIYPLTATNIDGEQINFSQYKGKVLLVVNTASRCGFTSQYSGLEELYEQYKDKNFLVLGFPSNDFANQEPEDNQEIKKFCKLKYDVSFPMFSKGEVKGKDKQAVYKFLTEESGSEFAGEIAWNFEKFLIGKDGRVRARYSSFRGPTSDKIKSKIQELIAE